MKEKEKKKIRKKVKKKVKKDESEVSRGGNGLVRFRKDSYLSIVIVSECSHVLFNDQIMRLTSNFTTRFFCCAGTGLGI